MKLILIVSIALLIGNAYADETRHIRNEPKIRQLNYLEKIFVETKRFELFYKWNDLSSEMKSAIKSFTGEDYAVSFGQSYQSTDVVSGELESSQIRYSGVSDGLEFIYLKILYHNPPKLILISKESTSKPKACMYEVSSNSTDEYETLQFYMMREWDIYDNYSEGVKLVKCL